MCTSLRWTAVLFVVIGSWLAGNAQLAAAEASEMHAAVAPFVSPETLVVMVLELQDEGVALGAFEHITASGQPVSAATWDSLQRHTGDLSRAGGRQLVALFEPADLIVHSQASLVVLLGPENETAADRLAEASREALQRSEEDWHVKTGWEVRRHGKAVAMGNPARLAALASRPADDRPALPAALAHHADASVRLLYVPSAMQRRLLAEMLPTLVQAENMSGPLGSLIGRVKYAVLASNEPRDLRLTLEADEEAVAEQMQENLTELVELALTYAAKADNRYQIPQETLQELRDVEVPSQRTGSRLEATLEAGEDGMALLDTIFDSASEVTGRRATMQKLKRIGLALHIAYDASHGERNSKRLPDTAVQDEQGRPLLSWRVHVLPFLDQDELYRQFRLDEPWDSEHNRKLIPRMPEVYRLTGPNPPERGKTVFLLPTAEGTMFAGGRGRTFREVIDGTSNTIMVVEADNEHAVIWTKPDDFEVDLDSPRQGLGGHFKGGFHAAYADGSARFLSDDIADETIRAVFTVAGEELIER